MATPAQIRSLTNHLRNSYGQKGYDDDDERLGFIVDECSFLPTACLDEIRGIFKNANPRILPPLFTDAIKDAFQEWLRRHPDKRAHRVVQCSDCDSTGLLHVRSRENIHEVYCFQCVCGQFGGTSIPTRSIGSLLGEGYLLDTQELFSEYRVESKGLQYRTGFEPDYEQIMRELESRKKNMDVPF